MDFPRIVFSTPRTLPDARTLEGRVVVLDIAFAADGMGTPFEEMTGRFLTDLGDRLAAWVDHHDHDLHERFRDDPRFVLATKAEHGACPEMVVPELVHRIGPVDTILTHLDLDGIYAAVKWVLGGREPYPGASSPFVEEPRAPRGVDDRGRADEPGLPGRGRHEQRLGVPRERDPVAGNRVRDRGGRALGLLRGLSDGGARSLPGGYAHHRA